MDGFFSLMNADAREHWDHAYSANAPDQVSWFERSPKTSISLIEEARIGMGAAIIDVGGGASRLAGELVRLGYEDVTVADIAPTALRLARSEATGAAATISFIEADVRDHNFGRQFDLWHDRAVLHFMVAPTDRDAYLKTLSHSTRSGGFAILATFGPDGPEQCSGLPVRRYGAEELAQLLGEEFEMRSSRVHIHATPSGREQQFQYALFRHT